MNPNARKSVLSVVIAFMLLGHLPSVSIIGDIQLYGFGSPALACSEEQVSTYCLIIPWPGDGIWMRALCGVVEMIATLTAAGLVLGGLLAAARHSLSSRVNYLRRGIRTTVVVLWAVLLYYLLNKGINWIFNSIESPKTALDLQLIEATISVGVAGVLSIYLAVLSTKRFAQFLFDVLAITAKGMDRQREVRESNAASGANTGSMLSNRIMVFVIYTLLFWGLFTSGLGWLLQNLDEHLVPLPAILLTGGASMIGALIPAFLLAMKMNLGIATFTTDFGSMIRAGVREIRDRRELDHNVEQRGLRSLLRVIVFLFGAIGWTGILFMCLFLSLLFVDEYLFVVPEMLLNYLTIGCIVILPALWMTWIWYREPAQWLHDAVRAFTGALVNLSGSRK